MAPRSHELPKVWSVPATVPFLPTLAAAILDGTLVPGFPQAGDPLALSRATIWLPTRRAARALALELASRVPGNGVLLPRIVPLGDVDAAEFALWGDGDAELLPEVPDLERHLLLTRLVLEWSRTVRNAPTWRDPDASTEEIALASSPADASALARDLAALMDDLALREIDWKAFAGIVENRFDKYFDVTLKFLEVASKLWPDLLRQRGAMDPALRRDTLLRRQARRLREQGTPDPVIVAGSTGSIPATAALIAAVARLPQGAVVLPGLDTGIDDNTFAGLTVPPEGHEAPAGHPQTILAELCATIGIARTDIRILGEPDESAAARLRLLSEAMRPAATTHLWSDPAHAPHLGEVERGLKGLRLVEAADEREEALAIALAMRETLEIPDATAALVTPDRDLARRVCTELDRWGISLEDSAGQPLASTPAGRFARLVAEAAMAPGEPRALLALLHHPLARFGLDPDLLARARTVLELAVLRGPALPPGWEPVAMALDRAATPDPERRLPRPVSRLPATGRQAAGALLDACRAVLEPLAALSHINLVRFAEQHRAAVTAASADLAGESLAFKGPDGEGLAELFDDIAACAPMKMFGRPADYPDLFEDLARIRVVAPRGEGHPRLRVWGLLEARLMQVDRLVVAGLDETVWPPSARSDAFLNRPMRAGLSLPSPERRLGQTAHDFVQMLGHPEVVVTRALKRGGAPTVPSRFLQRLEAYLGTPAWTEVRERGRYYLGLARHLDRPREPTPGQGRPEPRPPRALIPTGLSVTEVETLTRDPYALFAKHVLGLDPLPGLAVSPGRAERGTALHAILQRFAQACPADLPPDAHERLVAIAREEFASLDAYPVLRDLYLMQFDKQARAILAWEEQRRPELKHLLVESACRLDHVTEDGTTITLRGRADRLEIARDGTLTILDFKTGSVPGANEVTVGFAPQLTLEIWMAARGGFRDVPAMPLDSIAATYVKLKLGDALELRPVKGGKDISLPAMAARDYTGFLRRMQRLLSGEDGFMSRPYPKYARSFGDYDHLARVREWALAAQGEGEGTGE